jgi:hypothetical protein
MSSYRFASQLRESAGLQLHVQLIVFSLAQGFPVDPQVIAGATSVLPTNLGIFVCFSAMHFDYTTPVFNLLLTLVERVTPEMFLDHLPACELAVAG